MHGYSPGFQFWSHFLYIHNLFPSYASIYTAVPWKVMTHLWSMGVEEQFYLLWPLVVWICPNRRILLRVTLILIAVSFALRFIAAWMKVPVFFMYYWTPTRVDAILFGAVLAMIRGKTLYRWLESIAQYVLFGGICAITLLTEVMKRPLLGTPLRAAFSISLWNIMAAAVVMAVMREGSFLCRACSTREVRWFGARSYGLYLFHATYLGWFYHSVFPFFVGFMPYKAAFLLVGAIAFALTLLIAAICYRWIEEPAMNLKKRFKYGKPRESLSVPLSASVALPERQ